MKNKKYGWIPDVPDHRDYQFENLGLGLMSAQALPSKIDLSNGIGACYDQGNLGSCTGQAIAGAIEFLLKKELKPVFTPSRLFIYYNERVMENTVSTDSGAMIRDGVKSINLKGSCPESDWPYIIQKFKNKPTTKAYQNAALHKSLSYARVRQDLNSLKICLASGYPIIFGISVYASFETDSVAKSGEVPMPSYSEELLGGHAILMMGFDDATERFLCRNSWGNKWGVKGYFTIPYQYVTDPNLADDFWTIHQIT